MNKNKQTEQVKDKEGDYIQKEEGERKKEKSTSNDSPNKTEV